MPPGTLVSYTVHPMGNGERPAGLLAETLARLLATPDCLPNSPGGHVWHGMDGVHLLWPESAAKFVDALPGVRPHELRPPDGELLKQLMSEGIVHALLSPLVRIRLPGHDRPQVAVRPAEPCHALEQIKGKARHRDSAERAAASAKRPIAGVARVVVIDP